ncbi:RICIN domain-containing protein [Streptantibioticus silvisoli]|uniref:RICIN domain-containing protein n=1 Tax=Streptantibioticus silvisoli TaxID=2705255 RepID=A0ABT6VUS1_9ACTN|nr:RICIN domain-containing protein [Streptantibioticus silvisoli]MDI5961804.1 RICIN domain-containing protein [Streptantibioticus silvisoli]
MATAPAAHAASLPTGFTTVVNVGSGKCVDARAAGTADGTAVQQYDCNGSGAQQWELQPTSGGYYQVDNFSNTAEAWDVTDVSTADGALIQTWTYGGGQNQQWLPVAESGGSYHFVNRDSGKCLDVPSASTADSVQLQQYDCNGTASQSFTLGAGSNPPPPPGTPDFGPNVTVFDPSESASTIQSRINSVYSQQETNQFGQQRYAMLFKPGTYNVDVPVGYYTEVAGLGLSPDDVTINGGVHVDAKWDDGNATQNFWRDAENMSVNPTSGTDMWAVSQADPYRRMDLHGNLQLWDNTENSSTEWASGGFIGDSRISGQINSGSQQQFLTRNTTMQGGWTGSNWNMVFVGDTNAPSNNFPSPPDTSVAQTPTSREKPFLYVDGSGNYQVFVPAPRTNSQGASWTGGSAAGTSLPISDFFIAQPSNTAADLNAALAAGKNLLFTPGVYHLTQTLNVTRPDTVVLGLGLATLEADNGVTAISTADVDGIDLAGLLIDAGTTNSATLVQIGPAGSSAGHASDPTTLSDFFVRIGGAAVGKATQSVVVNSANVIGDDLWLWRADHGTGVGWTSNTAANGLVVNGANVTMYGLAVEHYQQYQTTWNGNGGRTYFYQSEMPYDPPSQSAWRSGSNGYASYKVGASVTSHEAWGLGVYCFFNVDPSMVADRAIEVPAVSGVKFHDMMTFSLGGDGSITHIINSSGGAATGSSGAQNLTSGP